MNNGISFVESPWGLGSHPPPFPIRHIGSPGHRLGSGVHSFTLSSAIMAAPSGRTSRGVVRMPSSARTACSRCSLGVPMSRVQFGRGGHGGLLGCKGVDYMLWGWPAEKTQHHGREQRSGLSLPSLQLELAYFLPNLLIKWMVMLTSSITCSSSRCSAPL